MSVVDVGECKELRIRKVENLEEVRFVVISKKIKEVLSVAMGMRSCHHKTPAFIVARRISTPKGFRWGVGGQRNGRQHLLRTPNLSNSTHPYAHVKWAMLGLLLLGSFVSGA